MNNKPPILWFTEANVAELVPLNDAIDALERVLEQLGRARAFNVPKALGTYADGSSMHSLGAGAAEAGFAGFKNWVFTKRGATALYTLFDANDGRLAAVLEAASLGQLRTSAISGLATRWMASESADTLALIGTGSQALTQAIAVALVRPLREIRVFGRDPGRRAALVERLSGQLDCVVRECHTIEQATDQAGIVTIVTRAQDPFLSATVLAPGAHLNAVGAILPANAEFHQDVFDRASLLAVDDLAAVKTNSREFSARFGPSGDWSAVHMLSDLIAQRWRRAAGADLTLFKAMGMGVSDLAIAMLAFERRQQLANEHRSVPQPVRAALRWQRPTQPGAVLEAR